VGEAPARAVLQYSTVGAVVTGGRNHQFFFLSFEAHSHFPWGSGTPEAEHEAHRITRCGCEEVPGCGRAQSTSLRVRKFFGCEPLHTQGCHTYPSRSLQRSVMMMVTMMVMVMFAFISVFTLVCDLISSTAGLGMIRATGIGRSRN